LKEPALDRALASRMKRLDRNYIYITIGCVAEGVLHHNLAMPIFNALFVFQVEKYPQKYPRFFVAKFDSDYGIRRPRGVVLSLCRAGV
jgi:hypothetical protein